MASLVRLTACDYCPVTENIIKNSILICHKITKNYKHKPEFLDFLVDSSLLSRLMELAPSFIENSLHHLTLEMIEFSLPRLAQPYFE
jgi:hypothetical protein